MIERPNQKVYSMDYIPNFSLIVEKATTKYLLAQPKAPKMQKCKNQATIGAAVKHINKLVRWVWYPRGRRPLVFRGNRGRGPCAIVSGKIGYSRVLELYLQDIPV
jgi:hypothetical protein